MAHLLLIAATAAFFAGGLFFDERTIRADTATTFFPALYYSSALWKEGIAPLWNPFLFNGYPAFADPQNQTFYPPTMLMGLVFDFTPKVVYVQLVLHYLLAGISMFVLAGLYMASTPARLVSALMYMFSGYMVNHFQHLPMINTVAWYPLILYLLERGYRERYLGYGVGAGLAMAMAILAGHPQTIWYMSGAIVAAALMGTVLDAWSDSVMSLRRLQLVALGAAVGLGISAVQIIPLAEFQAISNRSASLSYELVTGSGQITPQRLVSLALPDHEGLVRGEYTGEGDPSHASIYPGLMGLICAGFAFRRRDRHTMLFLAMAVFGLLVSMGRYGGVFDLLYRFVPGYDVFRSPAHFRFVFALYVALLAGRGVEVLISPDYRKAAWQYVYLAILPVAFLVFYHASGSSFRDLVREGWGLVGAGALWALVLVVVAIRDGVPRSGAAVGLVVAGVVFADLYLTGSHSLTIGDRGDHRTYEQDADVTKLIRTRAGLPQSDGLESPLFSEADVARRLYRVYVDTPVYSLDSPLPNPLGLWVVGRNRAMLHDAFLFNSSGPLALRRHVELSLAAKKNPGPILSVSNVRFMVAQSGDRIDVWELEEFLPRAYLVARAQTVTGGDQALAALTMPGFDPRTEVVLETSLAGENSPPRDRTSRATSPGSVAITRYEPNQVALRLTASRPAYLVLSETYYPGWEVSVDGQSAEILRGNHCFRALEIQPGTHDVIFAFRPASLVQGLFISAATLLGVLVWWGLIVRRRRSRQDT